MTRQKGILEKILYFLFPSWILNTTPFADLWLEKKKRKFIQVTRVAMWTFGIGYALHYFFVDQPLGLAKESEVWFYYRFGILFLSLLTVAITYIDQSKNYYISKIFYFITCSIAAWAQARSILWYSEVSSTWSFFITIVCSIFFVTESFLNIIFMSWLFSLQWPSFISSNQNQSLLIGSCIVSYFILFLNIKNNQEEVENFLIVQKQIETERYLAEIQQSLGDQIKSFLPSVINNKIQNYLRNGFTVTQAIDEVLRPKTINISVLFSDIRGFTKASMDTSYVIDLVYPNIRHSTIIIEESKGVPRIIGDLLFAYFESVSVTPEQVFTTALDILKINNIHNNVNSSFSGQKIIRYVVLDSGVATCGNLGGVESSREITALGVPVNRAARIDELSKILIKKKIIPNECIVMSSDFYLALDNRFSAIEINLKEQNLEIRDFTNEEIIYFVPLNSSEFSKINDQGAV